MSSGGNSGEKQPCAVPRQKKKRGIIASDKGFKIVLICENLVVRRVWGIRDSMIIDVGAALHFMTSYILLVGPPLNYETKELSSSPRVECSWEWFNCLSISDQDQVWLVDFERWFPTILFRSYQHCPTLPSTTTTHTCLTSFLFNFVRIHLTLNWGKVLLYMTSIDNGA